MNMIGAVNEAINRKLNSISFTNIIVGTVESLKPLQIRINSRILIGQSFIEPMSLGLNDYSPSSALPLVVGEKIQMVRYNNGQRFYILGKTVSASAVVVDYEKQVENKPVLKTTAADPLEPIVEPIEGDIVLHKVTRTGCYADICNKPKLNTSNTSSLAVNSSEEINETINLHKVAKTGSYNDLNNRPIIDYKVQAKLKDSNDHYINAFNGRVSSINFSKTAAEYGTKRSDLLTSSVTDLSDDPGDGFIETYFWDNSGTYDTQLYIPNGNGKIRFRSKAGKTDWGAWNVLASEDYVKTNFLQFEVIEEF
ncbi:MAG: hypothetical protein ACI3T9_01255 [Romboutsia timonensis]